ncbi:hypothetical protein DF00_16100, partial [Salmonella enterica subsp. enterica serovar Newport]
AGGYLLYPFPDRIRRIFSVVNICPRSSITSFVSVAQQAAAAVCWRRNNGGSDENGATPHPPAVFVLKMISVFPVVQNTSPDRASAGALAVVRQLKCVKQISKISVFVRLPAVDEKYRSLITCGNNSDYVTFYVTVAARSGQCVEVSRP